MDQLGGFGVKKMRNVIYYPIVSFKKCKMLCSCLQKISAGAINFTRNSAPLLLDGLTMKPFDDTDRFLQVKMKDNR
jgi:hypothetical protein